jgi:hypothetical protein
LALIVAVVSLVAASIVVHVGCSCHVRSHGEIAECLGVFLRITSTLALWIALALGLTLPTMLVIVLVIVVLVLVLSTMLLTLVVSAVVLVGVVCIGVVVTSV